MKKENKATVQRLNISFERVEAINSFEMMSSAVRFFVFIYNNKPHLPSNGTWNSAHLAKQASFLFGKEIKEASIMYAAEMFLDINDKLIPKIKPFNGGGGHYIDFAVDGYITDKELETVLYETSSYFNPNHKD